MWYMHATLALRCRSKSRRGVHLITPAEGDARRFAPGGAAEWQGR
jgi:hypothetical protein